LLAIVTAGALAHVAVRIKSIEVAYALGRERHIATELEEQRRRLQIEIGMLKDPGRVVMIARDQLKMGPPGPDAIRALGDSRHLADLAPAASPPSAKPSHDSTARDPAARDVTRRAAR
jgi:cell division protein FtsL